MIRGVRGATTVEVNSENEIIPATESLVKQMIELNNIDPSHVASVFISVTEDLTDTFPAKALRLIDGWTHVPVMCMREIPVPSGLQKCIRVMMHVNTNEKQEDIHHVYLEKAVSLRPDLKVKEN